MRSQQYQWQPQHGRGGQALNNNTLGNDNIALGFGAGGGVIDASNVICIGRSVPGFNVSNSCFIGNIFGAPMEVPMPYKCRSIQPASWGR